MCALVRALRGNKPLFILPTRAPNMIDAINSWESCSESQAESPTRGSQLVVHSLVHVAVHVVLEGILH